MAGPEGAKELSFSFIQNILPSKRAICFFIASKVKKIFAGEHKVLDYSLIPCHIG